MVQWGHLDFTLESCGATVGPEHVMAESLASLERLWLLGGPEPLGAWWAPGPAQGCGVVGFCVHLKKYI